MSKVESRGMFFLKWFLTGLFVSKVFMWHDKFINYDNWWEVITQAFIFRDSFAIIFVVGIYLLGPGTDYLFRKHDQRVQWVVYWVVAYGASTVAYMVYQWTLQRFFQAHPDPWHVLLSRWTVQYVIVQTALYVKYFLLKKKPEEKRMTQINKHQKIRLKTGEEAVVVEILNNGKGYRVEVPQGDAHYSQREISCSDIKSVFESIERPFTTIV